MSSPYKRKCWTTGNSGSPLDNSLLWGPSPKKFCNLFVYYRVLYCPFKKEECCPLQERKRRLLTPQIIVICCVGSSSGSNIAFWCRSRILPQVLHMMENKNLSYTFIHSCASLHCFIFLFSVIAVIMFNILDSILKFPGKECYSALHGSRSAIRAWIPIRIRQNDADLIGSVSTTPVIRLCVSNWSWKEGGGGRGWWLCIVYNWQ